MTPDPRQLGADNRPRPPVPAWASPGVLMANAGTRVTSYTLAAGVSTSVAIPDPRRIAIMFIPQNGVISGIFVNPAGPADAAGFLINGVGRDCTFDILTFGPITNLGWTAWHSAGASLTVVEVYQLY